MKVIIGCCSGLFLIFVIFLIINIFPFIRTLFFSGAITTSSPLPSPTTTFYPTSTPANTSYPPAQACQPIGSPSSAVLDIDTSSPGLKQNIDTHYYQIYGSTLGDLIEQMHQCGPQSDEGVFDAYTAYNINWQYLYIPVREGCNIKNLAVGVQIDLYYPKWEPAGNYEFGLESNWQAYIANLEKHESVHKDYDLDAAQEILATLSNLPSQPTCDEMGTYANSQAEEIMANNRQRNEQFDEDTRHGTY